MSMYSDYKCSALSEDEFRSLAARENRRERAYVDDFEKLYYEDEEDESKISDFVEDDTMLSPTESAAQDILKAQLMAVIETLTPREQKVIRLRYGLDDNHARTLEEVGKEFNVTRERIRQIEAKALRKLRHPNRSKKLQDFNED